MIKILFVCHGNICRSPMAEFVMKNLAAQKGWKDRFVIASAAVSREEIGNPVHVQVRKLLSRYGISTEGKYAVQLKKEDYENYDYLIGMDQSNIERMLRILGGDPDGKVKRLLSFTKSPDDIADPWYTGDFEETYRDVLDGCRGLLEYLMESEKR